MNKQIFYKRLLHEWTQKWNTIRSIVDWTIALYFVIPALVFAGMYQSSLWHTPPDWVTYIPLPIACTLLFVLTSFGSVRSFLEPGDSLFLIQHPHFLRSIIVRGMWYTFCKVCLLHVIIFAYTLPIFVKGYNLNIFQVLILLLFHIFMSYIQMFLNRYWAVRIQKKWEQKLLHLTSWGIMVLVFSTGVFLLTQFAYVIFLYGPLLGFFLQVCIRHKLHYQRFFLQEAEQERREALRWTSTVLIGAGHVQKPVQSKKPWIFPRSKRLWKTDKKTLRIAELFLKQYFRTDTNRQFYFLVTGYSSAAFYMAPWWLCMIVIVFVLFAIFKQSGEQWKLFTDKLLLRLYCPNGELLLMVEPRISIFLPALLFYGIIALGIFHIWAGIAAGCLAAGVVIRYVFIP